MTNGPHYKKLLVWLLPTGVEAATYFFFALVTVFAANAKIISQYLYAPPDLNIWREAMRILDDFLARALGLELAAHVVVGVFWGMIGVLVYFLYLAGRSFSAEIGNSLAETSYIRPAGTDKRAPVKEFLFRLVLRAVVLGALFYFGNLFITVLLPYWVEVYQEPFNHESAPSRLIQPTAAFIGQILAMHAFVVLFRLLFMRKRIFGGELA